MLDDLKAIKILRKNRLYAKRRSEMKVSDKAILGAFIALLGVNLIIASSGRGWDYIRPYVKVASTLCLAVGLSITIFYTQAYLLEVKHRDEAKKKEGDNH